MHEARTASYLLTFICDTTCDTIHRKSNNSRDFWPDSAELLSWGRSHSQAACQRWWFEAIARSTVIAVSSKQSLAVQARVNCWLQWPVNFSASSILESQGVPTLPSSFTDSCIWLMQIQILKWQPNAVGGSLRLNIRLWAWHTNDGTNWNAAYGSFIKKQGHCTTCSVGLVFPLCDPYLHFVCG